MTKDKHAASLKSQNWTCMNGKELIQQLFKPATYIKENHDVKTESQTFMYQLHKTWLNFNC